MFVVFEQGSEPFAWAASGDEMLTWMVGRWPHGRVENGGVERFDYHHNGRVYCVRKVSRVRGADPDRKPTI